MAITTIMEMIDTRRKARPMPRDTLFSIRAVLLFLSAVVWSPAMLASRV